MGFVITHGAAGAQLGGALGAVGEAIQQGQQQRNRNALVQSELANNQAYIDAAHRALAEKDAEREALGAYGKAQAELAVSTNGVPMQGPTPEGPPLHAKTGLPDYRDPRALQSRMGQIKALRASFPNTPEGNVAYGKFATEQGELIQSQILDNQEAEAIDGLANRMASMSRQEDAAEFAPRFQQIEQGYRAAKNIQNPAARAAMLKNLAELEQQVLQEYRTSRVRVQKQASAQAQMQKFMGTLAAGDPRFIGVGALEAQVASAETPEEIDDAYADFVNMTQTDRVKGSDGAWRSPEQARLFEKDIADKAQQEIENQRAAQKQNFEYQKTAAENREKRRHNRAMEGRPLGQQLDTPLDIEKGANDAADAKHGKIDKDSTEEQRARWQNTHDAFLKNIRDEPGRYPNYRDAAGRGIAPKKAGAGRKRANAISDLKDALKAGATEADADEIAAKYGFTLDDFTPDELQ